MISMRQIVILTVLRLGENLDIPNGSLSPWVWPVSGLRTVISAPASSARFVLGLLRVILLPGCCFYGFVGGRWDGGVLLRLLLRWGVFRPEYRLSNSACN